MSLFNVNNFTNAAAQNKLNNTQLSLGKASYASTTTSQQDRAQFTGLVTAATNPSTEVGAAQTTNKEASTINAIMRQHERRGEKMRGP